MTKFILFSLYLCLGVTLLVVWPLMLHPTLPARRKLLLGVALFMVFVPGGMMLYAWLGVPQMAF